MQFNKFVFGGTHRTPEPNITPCLCSLKPMSPCARPAAALRVPNRAGIKAAPRTAPAVSAATSPGKARNKKPK